MRLRGRGYLGVRKSSGAKAVFDKALFAALKAPLFHGGTDASGALDGRGRTKEKQNQELQPQRSQGFTG
jgi:hypothetical protein